MTTSTERAPLTMAEVCEELKVSRSTFYAWRTTRQAPPCIKLPNGQIRIRRADLEEWLQRREDGA
jgi:excisionase family DNA binding protein